MRYNQEDFQSVGIDLGSTTGKVTRGLVSNKVFVISSTDYSPYSQGYLVTGERAWAGKILESNLEMLMGLVGQNYAALGVTGLSNSGLMVVERKTGNPLVAFYDKPPLTYIPGEDADRRLAEAKIDPRADVTYTWSKALAYAQRNVEILSAIGRGDLSFSDTGIEPMVCTLARLLTKTSFMKGPGFYSHETKGITGSPNGVTSKDTIRTLTAFGFTNDQYTVSDTNVFLERKLLMAGDFQTLLSYAKAMQDMGRLSRDAIGIETGSNMKIWMRAEGKSNALPRYADIGFGYRLLRNGAAVNPRIFMKYLLTEGTDEKEWFVKASSFAESAQETLLMGEKVQYMYFPKVRDDESIGVLCDRTKGRQIEWEEVASMPESEKAKIAAAVYAGVGAELRKMLEEIRKEKQVNEVYLHDQFVSEDNQPFKRVILASMLGNGFRTYLADIPNASEMIALSAARMEGGDDVISDRKIELTPLKPQMDLEDYYQVWATLREDIYDCR